jgi:hypothetical protein
VSIDRSTDPGRVGRALEPVGRELVMPLTGELVLLADPPQVALALISVRRMKAQLDEARAVLEDALAHASERAGTRTLHLGELTAVVSGGTKVEYDELELATRLREAGLPEERLEDLFVEVVSYRLDLRVAKSIAASNPVYAAAIDACRRTVPAPVRVSIKEGGGAR